ncbi:MAG: NUDIX hydrolase [Planctomycetes bacterium]|nr:NUDIX hydrolase [Planctomycetota bacterium]
MEDGRIVMIRNYRHAVERELWELPAGTCEPDESPIETARRELAEETGYRADEITPLTEFFTSPGFTTEWMYAFLATGLTLVGQNLQGGEEIEVVIISADDARRRFLEGGFRDGKTVALLGLYFARLNE